MRALNWMNDMDLLLWRHAEAVDSSPDHTRELTPAVSSRRVAWRVGWDNRPKNLKVLVSNAAHPPDRDRLHRRLQIVGGLARTATSLTSSPPPAGENSGAALVVSHQPALGRLRAAAVEQQGRLDVKKVRCGGYHTNRVRRTNANGAARGDSQRAGVRRQA